MSNAYDFQNLNPGAGVSWLQRLIAPLSSPETPAPESTPQGGLPSAAPTATPPGAPSSPPLPFGELPFGLSDVVRGYLRAGQPDVWGTQAPGAPDTTGAATPQDQQPSAQPPAPMEARPQPQFPPSPIQPRAELPKPTPAPTETPPEPTKAPPRQEPYIPSRRDTRPGAWGKPDLVEQGAVNYPGMLPGPYMPQPHEWRGVMQNSTRFLGQLGSGVIAPLAQGLFALEPAYWAAKQRGEEHKAKIAASNFALYAKQLAQKQAQESRDYGDAFAAYGPHEDAKGRMIPGDEDALREAILEIAAKNHDDKIPAVLARGGLPAVERLIRERDAKGKDASKVLIQMQRRNAIILQEQRIRANEAKLKADQEKQYPWLIGGGVGGGTPTGAMAPVPGAGAPTGAGEDAHEFDEHFGGTATPEPETPAPSEETPPEEKVDETSTEQETEGGETPATQREAASETPAAPAAAAAGAPAATAEPIESAQAAAEPAATPARPVRLAMRDTGTVSDAPRPGELPTEPPPRAPAAAPARAAAAGAPAPGTPEAMGATAPVPSLQAQPAAAAPQPGAAPQEPTTEGAPAAPAYAWTPTPSAAMRQAAGMTIDTPRGPMRPNTQLVETLAQQMVNGTIKIQDLRTYPDWVKNLARARGDEIIADMHRIARDPNIKGQEAVLAAVEKVNPEFSGALRSYIEGRISVPQSAWANPGYKNRTLELGSKADPGFNEYTAKNRAATLRAYSVGPEGKNLTALATAYRHLQDLRQKVQNMPPAWKRAIGGYAGSEYLGVTGEEAAAIGALRNAINTANHEYERVLIGGKPTVTGVGEQAKELPLVMGRPELLLGNIDDKIHKLRDRGIELRNGFTRGSGMQPKAMLDGFDAALSLGRLPTDADQRLDGTEGRALRELFSPQAAPQGTRPSPRTQSQPSGGVVDYRTYFGQ